MIWHLLTPEFPPACGGVGDYTALVGEALASAGDTVHVWHREDDGSTLSPLRGDRNARLRVHALGDRFGAMARAEMDAGFASAPGTILVQYVPSAFGLRGSNLPFCRWLRRHRDRGADIRVMFHEPYFYFGVRRPWRNAVAVTQRAMAWILMRAAVHAYFPTETWYRYLAPYGPLPPVTVLPIPATIPTDVSEALTESWRRRVNPEGRFLIGHFGTYGEHVATELRKLIQTLGRAIPHPHVLLIGEGSRTFAESVTDTVARIDATGRLDAADVAAVLRACDVIVAPYPDGVTTRRTSVMAGLSSGRPVVTTKGPLTEAVWRDTAAVALAVGGDYEQFADEVRCLSIDPSSRAALGTRGRAVYDARFALDNTVRALRSAPELVQTR